MEKPKNETPVDPESFKAFLDRIRSLTSTEQNIFAICCIIVGWFLIGILPFIAYGADASKSGPFGDTFGVSNSLFAGLTLVVVIYSLHEQRKTNARTIEIAEKTAILQSLTFFAEFQSSLMTRSKSPFYCNKFRQQSQFYIVQAMEILEELGCATEGVIVFSPYEEAASDLEEILAAVDEVLPRMTDEASIDDVMNVLDRIFDRIRLWKEAHSEALLGNKWAFLVDRIANTEFGRLEKEPFDAYSNRFSKQVSALKEVLEATIRFLSIAKKDEAI